jgi:hypothetical protein
MVYIVIIVSVRISDRTASGVAEHDTRSDEKTPHELYARNVLKGSS